MPVGQRNMPVEETDVRTEHDTFVISDEDDDGVIIDESPVRLKTQRNIPGKT